MYATNNLCDAVVLSGPRDCSSREDIGELDWMLYQGTSTYIRGNVHHSCVLKMATMDVGYSLGAICVCDVWNDHATSIEQ